ncbi:MULTISPECIES: hypothetical protein [unclassified Mesorhizobium]|uniref:hypothetical protein n=1 Tax=unclassified Mesorhizobium TaxID=325217 RepID=UPI000FCC1598|nr:MULTISPECIES: hypothetical protein [unclassified Mesorhizobium]RUY28905.1 hypothetical protein EN979_12040 [Mesorhizobium sp. M7A.F.Ca.US.001.04.2.1]RVA07722.1 hypothetical protein EN938_02100 [Mesorhizobium sp. M7A.F.Ca.US.001.02.1.1]
MPADAKQDRLPAAGPWTKYQSRDIPPGFRIVQQPPANVFDQFDPPAANVFDQSDTPAGKQGPWTRYESSEIPSGFRVVQQPPPASDPWSAFPDAPPVKRPPASPVGPFPGMLQPGNIDLEHRPIAKNADGSYSTVRSMSFGDDSGKEILVPTVSPDGKILPDQAAIDAHGKTGQTLGVFDTPAHADMYAGALHKSQEQFYGAQPKKPRFAGVPADAAPGAGGPWAAFPDASPAAPISTGLDVAESAASGVPRGMAETAMAPITLNRLGEDVGGWLFDKAEGPVRSMLGMDPATPGPERDRFKDMLINPLTGAVNFAIQKATGDNDADIRSGVYGAQDKTREIMDAVLHKPQTTPGKFVGTIAEFAAPGGIPSRAVRAAPGAASKAGRYLEEALGNVVAPALASEASGQATEGTQYEGLSRFLGALFGNAGAAASRAHNAPEAVIRRATEGTTEAEWQAARQLQDNSLGIDLSSPESLAQARGGASKLRDILRVVEGSTTGGNITAPFFAARPAQVDSAVGGVLDLIAPQHPQPSILGPRAAEAAGAVVDQTRQGINAQTRPLYQAAEQQLIPHSDFAPIEADPRFAAALERLRGNAELAPDYAGMPDNSIAVVDAVTKDMAARGEALSNSANPLYGPELAGRQRTGAADARNVATQRSPEYAQALAEQERLRRTDLNPLVQGPVGRLAAAKDTVTAGNALLPQNPLSGSAPEAADAVQRLVRQDPETTTALVRQNLADRYSTAQTETQGGSRESAGAKFHRSVAGNDQRQAVLDAVLRNLPGGQAGAAMPELLDVLQATMRRDAPGSSTAANQLIHGDLGARSPIGTVIDLTKSLGASFLTQAGDAAKRAQLRGNLAHLGDILTGPEAVQRTRAARDRRPTVSYPEAGLRTLFESGQTLQDPRGAR